MGVPPPASFVADLRHPIPLGRRVVPVARGRPAADAVGEALERRILSMLPRALVCLRVIEGQVVLRREILVGHRLVLVRCQLIAVRAGLIPIRGRLIDIRGHLIGVGRRLIGVGDQLVGARRLAGIGDGVPEPGARAFGSRRRERRSTSILPRHVLTSLPCLELPPRVAE